MYIGHGMSIQFNLSSCSCIQARAAAQCARLAEKVRAAKSPIAAVATVPAPVKGAVKESRAAKAAAGEDTYIYICISIYIYRYIR